MAGARRSGSSCPRSTPSPRRRSSPPTTRRRPARRSFRTPPIDFEEMARTDHNPRNRRLYLPIVSTSAEVAPADTPASIADTHVAHAIGCAQTARPAGRKPPWLTGVARDDLPDGGAAIWAQTIRAVRDAVPGCGVEVLPSDFKGGERDIATVIEAEPDVFAHNLETVRRLHGRIRPAFGYDRSLGVLRTVKVLRPGQVTKSNLILGMGERPEEVAGALSNLRAAGCDIVTMGQYLRPTPM